MACSVWVLVFYIIVVFVESIENNQDFVSVDECPTTQAHWNTASARKACEGATPDYQCAAIEKNVGKFGEICTRQGLSPAYKCAVLNRQTYNLDFADCKAASGCPTEEYPSSEIFKYPVCFGDFYGTTTTMTVPTTTARNITDHGGGNEDTSSPGAIVAIVISLLFVISLIAIILFLCRKRKTEILKWINQIRGLNSSPERKDTSPELDLLTHDNEKENRKPESEDQPDEDIESNQPVNTDSTRLISTVENECGTKENQEKLKVKTFQKLQIYLVSILKIKLEIKDLKEKTIIHHKSLVEHYYYQLPRDIEITTEKDDYNNFDASVVYTLLTNFCSDIKPPSRGWGYEPPKEADSLGADIERMRSLWNKMCDNDLNDIHILKEIDGRMVKRYGVIKDNIGDNHDDEQKMKIPDVKLNPECMVEDGVVVTQAIKSTLDILQNSNIVICKGSLGCGKTTALKHIVKEYKKNGWIVIMKDEQLTQDDTVVADSQKLLICCDNFTGRYNFSSPARTVLSAMGGILENHYSKWIPEGGSVKAVVLIHQHVYDELQKKVKFQFMQNRNITVDMDSLTRAEMLMIFKEQMKTGHCNKTDKCWFKNIQFEDLEAKLKLSTGLVARPAMTLVYTNVHELFSDESFSRSPLQSLERHFMKMKTEEPELYYTLMYIMFVEKYKLSDDLHDWCGVLHYSVTKDSIEKNISKLHCYVRQHGDSVEIKHEFMYIPLFHTCVKDEINLSSILKFHKSETVLQLLRPSHLISSTNEFSAMLPDVEKEAKCSEAVKHFAKRIADDEEFYSRIQEHPLMTDQYLSSKVKVYHCKEPGMLNIENEKTIPSPSYPFTRNQSCVNRNVFENEPNVHEFPSETSCEFSPQSSR